MACSMFDPTSHEKLRHNPACLSISKCVDAWIFLLKASLTDPESLQQSLVQEVVDACGDVRVTDLLSHVAAMRQTRFDSLPQGL